MQLAAELFAARGVEGTSMADIAAAAGMTTPALYHYFASRRDLEAEALRAATLATAANAEAARASAVDPTARLRAFVEGHVEFLERSGAGMIRFVYGSVIDAASDPDLAHAIDPGHDAAEELFRDIVREGRARGLVRDDVDVDVAVELLTACFTGIDVRYGLGRSPVTARRTYAELLDMTLRYLTP